ncbi:MAG TPA: hypothetical protein VHT52_24195, partial [Stellaceae bacterium]|nr:hypothetical protein [Stellaceae bacterium]
MKIQRPARLYMIAAITLSGITVLYIPSTTPPIDDSVVKDTLEYAHGLAKERSAKLARYKVRPVA